MNKIRIAVPNFTIAQGWSMGFDVSQTSIWTGKCEADVLAEYQLLAASEAADLASATEGMPLDLCSVLHAPEGAYVPFHHQV